MKNYLLIILAIAAQTAMAQDYQLIVTSVSHSGKCGMTNKYDYDGLGGALWNAISNQQSQQFNGKIYSSKQLCEASLHSMSGTFDGCTTKVSGYCRPLGGVDASIGSANVLGVNQGSSFYSTNGANEIRDWSNDYIERMLALNPDYPYFDPANVPTGDPEFDSALAEISINMPGGSFDFIEKPHDNNNQDFEDYMIVGGARIPVSVLDKPFDPKVLGEVYSDDLIDFDTEWQMIKKSRNLPDNDVYAFLDRVTSDVNDVLTDLLKKTDWTREELENKIWEWNYILNNYALNETAKYKTEKAILEKTFALAKYKVEYKATLNSKYIDSADEDKQATELGFLIVNGKTREQYYREELEKKENELIAQGISKEDIKFIKEQTEKEAIVKDRVSTMVDIAEGVEKFNAGFVGNDVVSQIVSGISEGATYGVMINNLITIKSYEIVADAINGRLDGLEKGKEYADNFYKEQKNKIEDISDVLKFTSSMEKEKNERMNRNDALKWSIRVSNTIGKIKERSKQDYYGALPDINKNEFIGREHVTTIRCNL